MGAIVGASLAVDINEQVFNRILAVVIVGEDQDDLDLILRELSGHAEELQQALQELSL